MMQIPCIHCGLRDESEFTCGGTSHMTRPGLDESDEIWGEYLFFRDNPKGRLFERWRHTQGCGQWFNIARSTVTHVIESVYPITGPPPP